MARTVRVTPDQYASRWGSGLKANVEKIREGVGRVTVSPGKTAAARADKWHAAMTQTSTRDKWARRIGAMTLEEWQRSMIAKGINRIAAGVDEAQPKMVAYAEVLIPHQNALLAQLEKMPDVTLEDNINKMVTFIRGMAKLQV